jgi:hypothetical protein
MIEMKSKLTEIIFLLDRSGSMGGLESDTIGGFNAFIEKQRKLEGDTLVTAVLFDDQHEIVWNGIAAPKVKLTNRTYEKVKELIKHQQEKYNWEFIFLGANIDAEKEADSLGIDSQNAFSFETSTEGVEYMYKMVSEAVSERRLKDKTN